MTVPTGGAAVSASTGALESAVTVTIPAGNYYLTEAGGVDSLLTTLQTQLNENGPQGYPQTAAAMQAACGYGTWSAGWLFNESSGALAAAFGAPSLTASGSPTYGVAGPRGGIDKAIQVIGGSNFSGGDVFDPLLTDIGIACVFKVTADTNKDIVTKGWAGSGFAFVYESGGVINLYVSDGVTTRNVGVAGIALNTWYAAIAVLDRAANVVRVAHCALGGSSPTVSAASASTAAIGSMNSATNFFVGAGAYGSDSTLLLSALYVAQGSGAASFSTSLLPAVQGLANAVNSSFSVALSTTTGRITCSNSFWPSYVQWTSTNLRDVLGFEYDFDYPQTATQMAAALGYGTWTSGAGYLCNESSGSLAAAFGLPATATALATPTYSHQGARGGSDKAISFDSVTDGFSLGDNYDLNDPPGDLVAVWVGCHTSTPTGNLLTKYSAPALHWTLTANGGVYTIIANSGGGNIQTSTASGPPVGRWFVGIAVVDRGAGTMRVGWRAIDGSASDVSTAVSVASLGSCASSANLYIGDNGAGAFGSPQGLRIAALYIDAGAGGVATGLSANLSTALSNFASSLKSQTGTQQAKGVVFLDCPLTMDGDPSQAPRATDLRQSEGPTGVVLGLAGNVKYRQRNLAWSAVPRDRVWESAATYDNASWEQFLVDTQYGLGHAWFTPSSRVQIYWSDAGVDSLVGGDANDGAGLSGWFIKGLTSVEPRMTSPPWTGLWRIEIPEIVSDG